MHIQVEVWQLVTFGFSLLGAALSAFWVLVKIIVWQFNKNLDARFEAQEAARTTAQTGWAQSFETLSNDLHNLDDRFTTHLAELPVKYQRREDAIRQEVNIVNRLDGLASLVELRFQRVDDKILEALRRT